MGTFLGILLCYGVAGPLSSNMNKSADDHNGYLHVLRVLLLSFLKGIRAHDRHRNGTPGHPRACASQLRRDGKTLQKQWHSRG